MNPGKFKAPRLRGTRGSAIVVALITVTTIGALGAAFLRVSSSFHLRQKSELENLQAFYLAEAGLAESFNAIRMGRTGEIGSEASPARFGGGLLWVVASETANGNVRLESTGMVGSGRATLALHVEPVEVEVGFFSDADLVIQSVLMVDGFDSEVATYQETLGERQPDVHAADLQGAVEDFGGSVAAVGHTDSGGLLASNGSVRFDIPEGDSVEIWGDVKPGPDGSIEGLDMGVSVMGDTDPSSNLIELPEVEVPDVSMAAPVRHGGVLPLVLPAGTSGHASIEVAPDCELILRGPATIVIGSLTLEPGAYMTLDTRLGDVELYITDGMDLQRGSVVTTTSEKPSEVSVQVAPITTIDKAPINLEATSQFHGVILSPATDVMVGSEFEIYGGVVAKRLEVGEGARLHFDSSGFEGLPIPRVVSWRIIELPAAIRGLRGDAFKIMGVDPENLEALSEAHDLSAVWLALTYTDLMGCTHVYEGAEEDFQWESVGDVVSIERVATREKEQGDSELGGGDTGGDPVVQGDQGDQGDQGGQPAGIRSTFDGILSGYSHPHDQADALVSLAPYSAEEWVVIYDMGAGPAHTRMLEEADAAAGGTGGN